MKAFGFLNSNYLSMFSFHYVLTLTGQLGHGDTITKYEPTPITSPSGVKWIGAATGRGHTLLLTSKGVVYSCGDNKCQQLGIDSKDANVLSPRRVIYRGKPIIKM